MAGDTECVPEIKALKNIDEAFKPKVVYPYHYMGQDLKILRTRCRASVSMSASGTGTRNSYRILIASTLLAPLAGCGGAGTSPSTNTARLAISFTPNPARVGTRPTLTIRETAGVGVTATKVTVRKYDTNGTQTSDETFTGQEAWFTCGTTAEPLFAHLAANAECMLQQSTRLAPSQLEFDQYVTDDNGHDLKFTSPRAITTP